MRSVARVLLAVGLVVANDAGAKPKRSDIDTRYLIGTAINCVDALSPHLGDKPPEILDRICGCEVDFLRRERLAGRPADKILAGQQTTEVCTDFGLAKPAAAEEASPFSKGLKHRSVLVIRAYAGCYRDLLAAKRSEKQAADVCICLIDDVRKGKPVPDVAKALLTVPKKAVDACLSSAGVPPLAR